MGVVLATVSLGPQVCFMSACLSKEIKTKSGSTSAQSAMRTDYSAQRTALIAQITANNAE